VQDAEEAQQTLCNLLHFIVRQFNAELRLINLLILLDRLTAQLLWCFHATILHGILRIQETSGFAGGGKWVKWTKNRLCVVMWESFARHPITRHFRNLAASGKPSRLHVGRGFGIRFWDESDHRVPIIFMSSTQFPNYLLSNRKRLQLSQEEVAFLLGVKNGAKMSRYERFHRTPTLETALACEVIFGRPASELFGGLYQKAEAEIARRANELVQQIGDVAPHKKTHLTKLANPFS
jgi:transcriptional regulator with XRE-family HTH domain